MAKYKAKAFPHYIFWMNVDWSTIIRCRCVGWWRCRSRRQSRSHRRRDRFYGRCGRAHHPSNLHPLPWPLSWSRWSWTFPAVNPNRTALFESKALKTFMMSALLSFSLILAVASFINSPKSRLPDLSSSSLAIIWETSLLCPAKPKFTKASFNSVGLMYPLPSWSKISKAALISKTTSRLAV